MTTEQNLSRPENIDELEKSVQNEFNCIKSGDDAEKFRIRYLGKKGQLRSLLKDLGSMPATERKIFGARANSLYEKFEQAFSAAPWSKAAVESSAGFFDPTLPGAPCPTGSIHPLVRICDQICDIFASMGFDIAYGPEVETDHYNFEALNFPKHHPARDMQDTFFVSDSMLLRTHTSPVQIRVMEKQKPPIRCIMPGKVFRHEEISSRSYCMFTQVEGLFIDKNVSMADLKGTLLAFARRFFDDKTRIKIRARDAVYANTAAGSKFLAQEWFIPMFLPPEE
jgi:phenylalanyl-tRNA synthetase alpha chain